MCRPTNLRSTPHQVLAYSRTITLCSVRVVRVILLRPSHIITHARYVVSALHAPTRLLMIIIRYPAARHPSPIYDLVNPCTSAHTLVATPGLLRATAHTAVYAALAAGNYYYDYYPVLLCVERLSQSRLAPCPDSSRASLLGRKMHMPGVQYRLSATGFLPCPSIATYLTHTGTVRHIAPSTDE